MGMQHAGHSLSSRWLGRVFSLDRCRSGVASQPPTFLCPTLWTSPSNVAVEPRRHFTSQPSLTRGRREYRFECLNRVRGLHTSAETSVVDALKGVPTLGNETVFGNKTAAHSQTKPLPENCVGCGAYSHTTIPGEPGYYDLERKNVKEYLGVGPEPKRRPKSDMEDVVKQALDGLDLNKLAKTGVDLKAMLPPNTTDGPDAVYMPLCDRCHNLKYYNNPVTALNHPELDDLMDTIEASPYKYNHIYHVLDAADFPMSLLPKIRSVLDMMPLRSQNRRSMGSKFSRGRKMELSFIITRSDLLGHSKDKVDSMMPYLREVLRDALGRLGRNVRLGNVRCVSAKRNWWTTELKREIFDRGGAGWMVGKVNVGKSALFAEVFPKGHFLPTPPKHDISVRLSPPKIGEEHQDPPNQLMPDSERSPAEAALLPETRPETNFPIMPVHSPVPGTTAAPIRIPFGNGKGELIDLPGISRGDLSFHVRPDKRETLIMNQRPWPEQQELPFGRSLLLGGFIRITPKTPNLQFLAYSFTPIDAHAAQTTKCIAVQEQAHDAPKIENISLPGTGSQIKSAGTFALKYDITSERAGSVVRAMKQRRENGSQSAILERLPFRVLGIDILIEGCGWVELVVQVRTKDYPHGVEAPAAKPKVKKAVVKKQEAPKAAAATSWGENGLLQTLDLSDPDAKPEPTPIEESAPVDEVEIQAEAEAEAEVEEDFWPSVEVFTPEGRFISSRRPMNAWMMNKPKDEKFVKRQRKSMKGEDKRRRMEARDRRGPSTGRGESSSSGGRVQRLRSSL